MLCEEILKQRHNNSLVPDRSADNKQELTAKGIPYRRCTNCRQWGHDRRNCLLPRKDEEGKDCVLCGDEAKSSRCQLTRRPPPTLTPLPFFKRIAGNIVEFQRHCGLCGSTGRYQLYSELRPPHFLHVYINT